jgi:hypothetical protein
MDKNPTKSGGVSMRFAQIIRLPAALAVLGLLLTAPAAYAQEEYIELLRSDIKTQKVAIMTEAMQLSDEEGSIFWPIYREYDLELSKLGDQRIALIKDYAANYESMTEEKAKELMDRAFKLGEDRLKLDKKYYDMVRKELGAIQAARFAQVENQIGLLIDVQIASEMPLVKKPGM